MIDQKLQFIIMSLLIMIKTAGNLHFVRWRNVTHDNPFSASENPGIVVNAHISRTVLVSVSCLNSGERGIIKYNITWFN